MKRKGLSSVKPMHKRLIFLVVIIGVAGSVMPLKGQQAANGRLSVFLDEESWVDADYIRQEIPVVEYVRDRELADVHIIMSRHRAGSTGSTYSISFIGYGEYENKNFEISCWVPATYTSHMERSAYTEKIKAGLAPFIAAADISDKMDITYAAVPSEVTPDLEILKDPWKNWVFEVYAGGNFHREESSNSLHIRYGVFSDRITKESRTRVRPYGNYNERNYITDDGTVTSTSVRGGLDSYHIISLSDHWAAGVFGDIFISTYHNMDFSAELSPAIEYSLFPYEEATRRSITFAWRIGAGYYDYLEETIFEKTEEILFGQAVIASANFRQPWGDIRASLVGFHHFHDFRSNRTELSAHLNLRIIKGLALNIRSSYSLINDQVAIPKADLSLEEILLEQRRRTTSYEFSANIGLSYTFGSRITGVFNPRLDL